MVQQIDGSSIPTKLTSPRRLVSIIMSLFFGFFFSIFLSILKNESFTKINLILLDNYKFKMNEIKLILKDSYYYLLSKIIPGIIAFIFLITFLQGF